MPTTTKGHIYIDTPWSDVKTVNTFSKKDRTVIYFSCSHLSHTSRFIMLSNSTPNSSSDFIVSSKCCGFQISMMSSIPTNCIS